MIQLFTGKKGAISVFMSLIMLPMLIVAFLANDAARIYSAKVVVSDAGEMAMNAGLAQYDAALKDEYGLITMENQPSSMAGDLEKYFTDSLNMADSGNYHRILDLMEEQFEVLDIEASKVYKTEVEKQQILEYMKYRAPVCMAEMILEKLDQIKDNKKMVEAMEAEADFAEAMQDVQDAFEEAKLALDDLNSKIESFPNQSTIETELENTERDYKGNMSKAFLMRAAISVYDAYDKNAVRNADTTEKKFDALKSAVTSFISQVDKINTGDILSSNYYNNYIDSMYYKNTVEALGDIGKLLEWYDDLHTQDSGDTTDEQEGEDTEDTERTKLSELVDQYKQRKDKISSYATKLLSTGKSAVTTHFTTLNAWWKRAEAAATSAKRAAEKLQVVKEKLEIAAQKHQVWEEKTNALANPGSMKEEVDNYKDMFDTESCEILTYNVETDKKYFDEIRDILTEEKFFDRSIATTQVTTQCDTYNSEANSAIKSLQEYYYDNIDDLRANSYSKNYVHTTISTANVLVHIESDPFYQQLIKYCENIEGEEKNKSKDETNEKLDEGQQGAEEAKSDNGYPTYDWSSAGVTLPSNLLGYSSYGVNTDKMTDVSSGDIDNKADRKNIIKKVKESIKEASSFIDGVDRILSAGLENLYIAEYALQMFSYYTVDKQYDSQNHTVTELKNEDILSLSGYSLSAHKAYKGECEYILWGKSTSKKNIQATVAVIYGIRLMFNVFFALTDSRINGKAEVIASPWTAVAPYLGPIIKLVFKFGLALYENADDIKDIKAGWGVAVIKDKDSWVAGFAGGINPDNTVASFTFSYAEYLRLFVTTSMLGRGNEPALARIADCIQINTGNDTDITKRYTMLAVKAKVSNRTTFMRKIADWSGTGWNYGDTYSVDYQSVLGY